MTRGVVRVEGPVQVIKVESDEEPIQAHVEGSDTESSSSSSSASSSDLDGVEEHLVSPAVGSGVEKFESGPCWQHASSKMLHRAGRDASRLKCGRRVVAMHTWLEGGHSSGLDVAGASPVRSCPMRTMFAKRWMRRLVGGRGGLVHPCMMSMSDSSNTGQCNGMKSYSSVWA